MELLLSELGGYLLGSAQAPAPTKRISNLVQAANRSADDINVVLWKAATARVQTLQQAGDATCTGKPSSLLPRVPSGQARESARWARGGVVAHVPQPHTSSAHYGGRGRGLKTAVAVWQLR
jgi:hypothetical protein